MSSEFWLGASTLGPGTPAPGIRQLVVADDGRITLGPFVDAGDNPMFLARVGHDLAVVHELAAGRVSTISLGDPAARRLPEASTGAADPCHVAASIDGATLFVANYNGGSLTVHPVEAGVVSAPSLSISYPGSGPNARRQQRSHPHQAVIDDRRALLYVPDLGTDSIHVHSVADLLAGDTSHRELELAPGAGPRHLVVDGDHLLVANELDRTVVAVHIESGETVAVAPATARPGADDDEGTSAIRVTPTGHVLVGNRGPGTVGVLRWNPGARELTYVDERPCGGVHPRDLEITPDGRFVVVANQWSDQLAVLAFDPATVRLSLVDVAETPSPACVLRATGDRFPGVLGDGL